MERWFWMMTAIPVMISGTVLHFRLKGRLNILPKCLATWMAVCTALEGMLRHPDQSGSIWMVLAMVLFLLSDALLELQFFAGMAGFAAGHLMLLVWLAGLGTFQGVNLILWAALMAGALWVFRRELTGGRKHPGICLMLLYPAVLMGMISMAVTLPFRNGPGFLWGAAGAVLFGVSDMMVGKSYFRKLPLSMDYLALGLYYCGIYCLAMTTW